MRHNVSYHDWIRLAQLNSQLPLLEQRVHEARLLIHEFIANCENPYIAYSGGKDSQIVVDLSLTIKKDVQVVWNDEDWILPGTIETVVATEQFYDIEITRVRDEAAIEYEEMFGRLPYWRRHREVDFEAPTWREIVEHFCFDGVLLGLRRGESVQRLFALKEPLRLTKADGLWHCSPIFNWNSETVWAYMVSQELPIHPAYQTMIDNGHVDPYLARIGPLTAVRVWQYGMLDTVKRLWPTLWNEFVLANPDAQ